MIAAYGFGSGAALRRLAGIAALSSFGQATVAIVLIYAGVWLYDGARERVEGLAARLDPIAMMLIAGLRLMLFWRGLRHLDAFGPRTGHDHVHNENCGCGHAHAPDPAAVSAAHGWREAAALVLGVALRPCTGALFLLILTWRLDIDALGILGAYVMGFGTFMVTGTAAILAVVLRNGMQVSIAGLAVTSRIAGLVELAVGALVFVLGISAAFRLL